MFKRQLTHIHKTFRGEGCQSVVTRSVHHADTAGHEGHVQNVTLCRPGPWLRHLTRPLKPQTENKRNTCASLAEYFPESQNEYVHV